MSNRSLKLRWQGDPVAPFCPACGSAIFGSDEDEGVCVHIIFRYVDLVGDVEFFDDDVASKFLEYANKNRTAENSDDLSISEIASDMDLDELQNALEYSLESPSSFLISLEMSGIACGPMGCVSIAGIDFLRGDRGDSQE